MECALSALNLPRGLSLGLRASQSDRESVLPVCHQLPYSRNLGCAYFKQQYDFFQGPRRGSCLTFLCLISALMRKDRPANSRHFVRQGHNRLALAYPCRQPNDPLR